MRQRRRPRAIYKGLALADNGTGHFLYATDFHNGKVDVFDANFAPGDAPRARFTDPRILPAGFAPFGIQAIGGKLYVTYAKQDADADDDVAGPGQRLRRRLRHRAAHLLRRFATRGALNSPWGIALRPGDFGHFSNALLVGNFGDGRINAYDPFDGRFLGALSERHGRPIAIDGLWALAFGNGVIGTTQTLLFTAGPDEESHGLFGELTPRK